MPVARPSASAPAPSPSQAAEAAAYSAFRGRVSEAPSRFGLFIRTLSEALPRGEGAVLAATSEIRSWAEGERDWLATHDADGCYGEGVRAYSDALDGTAEAAETFEEIASGPSPAPSDEVAAVEILTSTGAAFETALETTVGLAEACS